MKINTYHAAAAICLGAALALRLSALTSLPWRIDGDAAVFTHDGLGMLASRPPLFDVGWEAHTHVWLYVVGIVSHIVPDPLLGTRLLSAFGGIAGVIATYAFAYRMSKSVSIGLMAASALAVSPFHLVFSRNGMELTWSACFLAAIIALLARNKLLYWAAAGVMTAASLYVAQSARVIPILVGIFVLFCMLHRNTVPIRRYLLQAAFWATTTLLFYAPQLLYYLYHPHTYNARLRRVSLFEPELLQAALQPHAGIAQLALYQISHSVGALFYSFPDATLLWYFHLPYLNTIPFIFFAIGVVALIVRIRQFASQYILAALVVILAASAITTLPPMSSRYVIAMPLICYLIAVGISTVIQLIRQAKLSAILERVAYGVVGICLVCAVITEVLWYLHHDQQLIFQHDTTTQKNTAITRYVREHPTVAYVYTPFPDRISVMVEAYSDARVRDIADLAPGALPPPHSLLFFEPGDRDLFGPYTSVRSPARELRTPHDMLVGYIIQNSAP